MRGKSIEKILNLTGPGKNVDTGRSNCSINEINKTDIKYDCKKRGEGGGGGGGRGRVSLRGETLGVFYVFYC